MEPVVVASKNGPIPEIELRFEKQSGGYFAKYAILQFDSAGLNPVPVGTGLNTDFVDDRFALPGPKTALNGALVSWEVIVSAFDSGSIGTDYVVRAIFTQDGNILQGGDLPHSGKLDDHFVRFARLVLV
jgi:hypothetical protein